MDVSAPRDWFIGLQARIVARLEAIDGQPFRRDEWTRPEGGGGISRLIEEGNVLERGGVNFSHVMGAKLPPSASAGRPEIAGRAWEAMGVSLVLHPRNPYAPTVHLNVRMFVAHAAPGRGRRRRGRRLVVRRRHGPHALLRVRGGRRAFPSHVPRRAGAVRRRRPPEVQALVRRVLLPAAPAGAARHRRHLLRRSQRRRIRPLLRAHPQRGRRTSSTPTRRSWRGARTCRTASASAISRRIAADATSNSTWSGTAARCSGCSRTAAPRRS